MSFIKFELESPLPKHQVRFPVQIAHSGSIAVPAKGHRSDRASPEARDSASERSLAFPYERRLGTLGPPSLVHLRLCAILVLVYNMRHGRVNLRIVEFFETLTNPNLRGHRFKLSHQLSHLARRKFAFPARIVEPWNKLPAEVVASASSNTVLMVFGTPFLFPNPPRTSNKFVFNLPFLPFVQMPVRGYLARKCLFLDH